jgi:hypothetical protein
VAINEVPVNMLDHSPLLSSHGGKDDLPHPFVAAPLSYLLSSKTSSSSHNNDSAHYGRCKLQTKKNHLIDVELLMHFYGKMPTNHMHTWYSECHSHIVSSSSQSFMPKIQHQCVLSSLWAEPTKQKNSTHVFVVKNRCNSEMSSRSQVQPNQFTFFIDQTTTMKRSGFGQMQGFLSH